GRVVPGGDALPARAVRPGAGARRACSPAAADARGRGAGSAPDAGGSERAPPGRGSWQRRIGMLRATVGLCLRLGPALLDQPAPALGHERAPRLDQYGDPLPTGAVARLGCSRLRPGHSGASWEVSPDGKLLATGEEGKLRLWEIATGRERWVAHLGRG